MESLEAPPLPPKGFPGVSVVKNPPANAGDTGSIPGWRRSPEEGNGNPLQCSCLGNRVGPTESDMTECTGTPFQSISHPCKGLQPRPSLALWENQSTYSGPAENSLQPHCMNEKTQAQERETISSGVHKIRGHRMRSLVIYRGHIHWSYTGVTCITSQEWSSTALQPNSCLLQLPRYLDI